jgi:DNA polymerase-3 subunit alpha
VDEKVATHIFDLMEKFAGYGFNKCVVSSTRVIDANTGEVTTVGSLFKSRRDFTVHALDDKWRLRRRRVEDIVWNGKKPVFELTTRLGKKIVATANHPFRCLSGWKRLDELEVGARIAVPRTLQVGAEKSWSDYQLITLAGLLSEGNTCHPSCLYFYSNDRRFAEDFADAVIQFPDTAARLYSRRDGRMEVCVNTGRDAKFAKGRVPWNASSNAAEEAQEAVEPSRSGAFLWAKELKILGKKANQKAVPPAVFELRDTDIELFLGRLWCGDGFIANRNQFVPYYATSSRQLAEDVQTFLLRLGIISRIHDKKFKYRGKYLAGYTVHLQGDASIGRFAEKLLPHVIGRDEQKRLLIDYIDKVAKNVSSKDTIPASIRTWVAEERLKRGITWKQLEEQTGVSMKEFYGNGSSKKQGFRRYIIGKLAAYFGSQPLGDIANADVFWDKVVSIEPCGVQDTYDLTVERDHNFVADGIVVHNSHSAAYALVSYQTAWLKTHYPAAFMAAVLSADMDNTDKVVTLIDECRDMKLDVAPPNINICEHRFTVSKEQSVIYGLGAIKGVGASAVEALIDERKANGDYKDLFDLCQRVDLRKVNRRTLEALIMAGALDVFGKGRATLTASLPAALQIAEQYTRDIAVGQNDMFGMAPKAEAGTGAYHDMPEWDDDQRLACEKQTLGLYLTGHPINKYLDELAQFTSARITELKPTHDQTVVVAGLIIAIRTMNTRRGDRMAFITLDDRSGRIELAVFADTYQRYRDLLVKDKLLVVEGEVSVDDYTGGYRMSARSVYDINQAREHFAKRLLVSVDAQQAGNGFVNDLQHTLQPFREGECPVVIDYQRPDARAEIPLGKEWKVNPTDELLHRLRELAGDEKVNIVY